MQKRQCFNVSFNYFNLDVIVVIWYIEKKISWRNNYWWTIIVIESWNIWCQIVNTIKFNSTVKYVKTSGVFSKGGTNQEKIICVSKWLNFLNIPERYHHYGTDKMQFFFKKTHKATDNPLRIFKGKSSFLFIRVTLIYIMIYLKLHLEFVR